MIFTRHSAMMSLAGLSLSAAASRSDLHCRAPSCRDASAKAVGVDKK